MNSIRKTLKNLKALSEDFSATDAERQAAIRAYRRLLKVHQLREQDLAEEPTVVESDIRYKTPAQMALLVAIGRCLGLDVYTLTTVRKLKRLRFKGDMEVVKLVPALFKAHRDAFERRVELYAAGLAQAMFPAAPKESAEDTDGPDLTPEEYEAMMSGYRQGDRVSVRPELQNVLGK